MAAGRKTGGRKKGTPNKATADIKAIASEYGPEAIERLCHLMRNGESEQVQLAAARELIDRGYGKPPQAITGNSGGPLTVEILRFSDTDDADSGP